MAPRSTLKADTANISPPSVSRSALDRSTGHVPSLLWRILLALGLFILLNCSTAAQRMVIFSPGTPKSNAQQSGRGQLIVAKHGAVASENEICSNVGVDCLKNGGNAVDASIATVFCVGVIVQTTAFHPSSIFGGVFHSWHVLGPKAELECVGRFVTGLGVGSLSMAVPLYK